MVSLSFYWCTPPCGGVPGPDLGQALRFRRSEVCCFLPSAGDLQRTRSVCSVLIQRLFPPSFRCLQ
ncbi:unnamed protein product [Brassica rapa]|uniref:Uncharacterized protein n=2 Tax=Brassica TaxID=3705 RepID=A0A8D9GF59_BRACM|nr:unnamed protein product [Brassica napus]CAG7878477.1 unnamed protein product [Brassica rapa]